MQLITNFVTKKTFFRIFPSLYYYKEFPIPNSKAQLGIVFVDTVLLCGNTRDDDLRQPKEQVDKNIADAQWDFVQNALKRSK